MRTSSPPPPPASRTTISPPPNRRASQPAFASRGVLPWDAATRISRQRIELGPGKASEQIRRRAVPWPHAPVSPIEFRSDSPLRPTPPLIRGAPASSRRAQALLDLGQQPRQVDRLGVEVAASGGQALAAVGLEGACGKRDDRDGGRFRIRLDAAASPPTRPSPRPARCPSR